jgi:hypothetical protein
MQTSWAQAIADSAVGTLLAILPIAAILLVFQALVLRERISNPRRIIVGFVYVALGLALFLVGLEEALFPLGRIMAQQLTAPAFVTGGAGDPGWTDYAWVYVFAGAIGFSTTLAEPSLMAVALKAREVSGGAVGAWGLRIAVAAGVGISVAVGTFRIVTGTPLYVVLQTWRAPRAIIPLAYDSGGVTTSTVTVPLVTALGLGLASSVPGRSPLIDGFGLIALASLFPMITVMGYAQISQWRANSADRRLQSEDDANDGGRG